MGPRSYFSARGISDDVIDLAFASGSVRGHRDQRGQISFLALASNNHTGRPQAVQRTRLLPDFTDRVRSEFGRLTFGPCKGSACRLIALTGDVLAVAEGVETALAVTELRKIPAWATFGTSNLEVFEPPAHVRCLVIAADGDAPGLAAAQALFDRLKKRVRCILAPAPAGLDWLDVLNRAGAPCH